MIVYTGGTFDCFHAGHVNLLKACKKMGKVVVALNSDEFIEEYKGKPPIMNFEERVKVLASCKYVDDIIKNESGADSKLTIERIMPDFIVVGTDWAVKDYYKQMQFTQEWLDERNITLCYVPYTQGISTTEIKRRINGR